MSAMVYLVGAGPGDPRLLTVRAAELLRAAEVVAYDELVSPAVLALANLDAELIPVGHRARGSSAHPRLHPAVLEQVRCGRSVVRLKQGDPLVFGRGGEEAEELSAAGVAFEIVPGVSAALGAAAYAGIPLTHRGIASEVTLTSGHDLEGELGSNRTRWSALAGSSGTLVLYMASRRLGPNLARLIQLGRAASTRAAWISAATTGGQRVVVGTLADLASQVGRLALDVEAPALVIVGEVVRLRSKVAWRKEGLLTHQRIVVARAREGESRLASELRALGAEVIEAPRIESVALADRSAFPQPRAGDAWVFGCAAAVRFLLAALAEATLDLRAVLAGPLVAVGKSAADALTKAGLTPAVRLTGSCDEAVFAQADWFAGRRLILVSGSEGRPSLAGALEAVKAVVSPLAVYELKRRFPRLPSRWADLVVLPSSSAARTLYRGLPDLLQTSAVAIGPETERAALAAGAIDVVTAPRDTVESVLQTVRDLCGTAFENALSEVG